MEVLIELRTLAKFIELGSEDGLDVLRVGGEDEALSSCPRLEGIGHVRISIIHELLVPEFEILVGESMVDSIPNEQDTYERSALLRGTSH